MRLPNLKKQFANLNKKFFADQLIGIEIRSVWPNVIWEHLYAAFVTPSTIQTLEPNLYDSDWQQVKDEKMPNIWFNPNVEFDENELNCILLHEMIHQENYGYTKEGIPVQGDDHAGIISKLFHYLPEWIESVKRISKILNIEFELVSSDQKISIRDFTFVHGNLLANNPPAIAFKINNIEYSGDEAKCFLQKFPTSLKEIHTARSEPIDGCI